MKIKTQLAGFGLFGTLFAVAIGVGGYWGWQNMTVAIADNDISVSVLHNHMQGDMMHDALRTDVLVALRAAARNGHDEQKEVVAENANHVKSLRAAFSENRALPLDGEIMSAIEKTSALVDAYGKESEELVSLAFKNAAEAEARLPKFTETFKKLEKDLEAISDLIQNNVKTTKSSAATAWAVFKNVIFAIFAICAIAMLLEMIAAYLIIRSLFKQLGGEPAYTLDVVTHIADGDLTTELALCNGDSTSLLAAMKRMQDNLRSTVGTIKESADSISTGSKQIASGNADLSRRTEEQASSLEETASSMEELTSTVKQNAENAKQANQLAVSASEVAVKGGQVVSEVVGTMSSINESSRKIVDIIAVIDGIAFQTNILALNAAVEAARAGEQGRGFAVVASEVRNLAQRSAAAAKEIKALIGDSVDKVGAGTKLVDEAGKTMEEIVSSVKRVTDIMSEISAASQEQGAGIEQVNQAITQMDEVTQQNAALVEEAAAAAESLEEQAQRLAQAVAVFNVGKAAAGATAGRGAAAAEKMDRAARPPAERRGPNRAPNVARLRGKPGRSQPMAPGAKAAARNGEEKWEEF